MKISPGFTVKYCCLDRYLEKMVDKQLKLFIFTSVKSILKIEYYTIFWYVKKKKDRKSMTNFCWLKIKSCCVLTRKNIKYITGLVKTSENALQ